MWILIILAFVNDVAEDFDNVKFIPKPGHIPTAVLMDEPEGEPIESYTIESWNTDTISDFFRERLL